MSDQYHIITTTHPYMADLGLSNFTTGVLYDWLTKNTNGIFPNLYAINEPFSGVISQDEIKLRKVNPAIQSAAKKILGYYQDEFFENNLLTSEDFSFTYYRITNNKVNLKESNLVTWACSDPDATMFSESNEIKDWLPKFTDKESYYSPIPIDESLGGPALKDRDNIDYIISNIVEINNFANIANGVNNSKEYWKSKGIFPAIEFITDFKTSIERCVQWSGIVSFKINDACIKNEWVKYKLFLYDGESPKLEGNKIAISADVSIDATTIDNKSGRNANGQYIAGDIPYNKKIGGLDLYQDPITGKFSAKPIVPGYLTTAIAASENPPIEDIEDLDLKTLRELTTMPTGKAIFLEIQNGNPLDWTPNYSLEESCRNGDTKKATVNVINPWGRTFDRGEKVSLTHAADNWWIVHQVPNNPITGADFVGNWDFSYFMTNHAFYFAREGQYLGPNINSLAKFSYDQYEQEFRTSYYSNYKYEFCKQLNIENSTPTFKIPKEGYIHITSWDFMRKEMGGTRPPQKGTTEGKNSLKYTVVGKTISGGEKDVMDGSYNYPDDTAPFFGCVFPNGYVAQRAKDAYDYTQPIENKNKVKATGYIVDDNNIGYLSQITDAKNIFEDINANKIIGVSAGSSEDISIGIFAEADKGNLLHLPADIALNCPPVTLKDLSKEEPYKGSPITNYSLIYKYMTPNIGENVDIEEFFKDPKKYSFFYKDNNIKTPFFGFEPISNVLQFRPLRAETYASLEACELWFKTIGGAGGLKRGAILGYKSYNDTINDRTVQTINENEITQKDDQPPLFDRIVLKRNQLNPNSKYHNLEIQRDYGFANSETSVIHTYGLINVGLSYGYLDARNSRIQKPEGIKDSTQYFDNVVKGYYPTRFWDEVYGNKPAGAIGIIGASVKYRITGDNINFNVKSVFGTRDQAKPLGSPTAININQILPGLLGVIPNYEGGLPSVASEDVPQWGSDEGYSSFNTTALYVRVFHAWPKHLTIYDPRYFAIHHFNDGVDIIDDPAKSSNVDLKFPTYENNSFVLDGHSIFSDGGYDINRNFISKMANKSDWKINTGSGFENGRHRRGKLLPYKYERYSIGIADRFLGDFEENKNKTVKEFSKKYQILVKNRGKDYQEDQILTTVGGGGTSVELRIKEINDDGGIKSLEIINSGKDFNAGAFMIATDTIDKAKSSVQIIKKTSTDPGEGFEAYIVFGRLITSQEEDEKPKEAIKLTRLTPSSVGNGDDNGIVNREEKVQILIENKNKTREYDIFYHFHNDISHVVGFNGQEDFFQFDQYVNVEITA